jgi:hypothetical protein
MLHFLSDTTSLHLLDSQATAGNAIVMNPCEGADGALHQQFNFTPDATLGGSAQPR